MVSRPKEFKLARVNIGTGLSQRAKHPAENIQPIHGSLFDLKCTDPLCTYIELDNFNDPLVPDFEWNEEQDISDVKVPLKYLSRDFPNVPNVSLFHGLP